MLTFFDCNCMLGKITGMSLPFHEVDDLLAEMERHNISKAMVFHSIYGAASENERLLKALHGRKNLYPVAVVSPWETSKERLTARTQEILLEHACGIRLFPVDENFPFSDSHLKEFMAIVVKRRLPVMIDSDQLGGFGALAQMMKAYPKTDFILTKAGVSSSRFIYDLFDRYPNFHVETSLFKAYQAIEDAVDRFGPDRILFGSYMPRLDAGGAVTRLIYAGLSRTHREKIAHGNIERLISKVRK